MPGHVVKTSGPDPDPSEWLFVSREMKQKDMTKPYDSKKDCWVPHAEEGYALGEIVGAKGDLISVLVNGETKNFKKDFVGQVNPPKYEKAEDMSNLTFLNDASVLYNLKTRYQAQLIYTYSGLFCIAVNPYKRFPIYTERAAKLYMAKRRNEVPPHLFAISDGAYQNMLQVSANQSMLITGESGAGKTENTKKVIAYFATVGASGVKAKPGEEKQSLEDQIVATNPVLEAFGNAKTTRNDNSSRFGKFIRIHFQGNGKLASADIENYLLEKSRVISQAPAERGYHIFYNIMSDFVPSLKKMCRLSDDIYDYPWQSQGKVTVESIDDKEDMEFAHIAFTTLLFSDEERDNIYKITSICMHLANMKFKQRGREEQAEPDEETLEHGKIVAELLGVEDEMMYTNFCKPKIKVGAEMVTKGQNVEKTTDNVGALAKGLFDRLFSFLVKKCNITLETGLPRKSFIGVLDIAGFEIFDYNGFEQICINFCNEKLQQFFNHHMFVLEQEEYKKEGINWAFVDFGMDLQACITLFEQKMGIFSILEEESMFPKATDKTFQDKLDCNHMDKSTPYLKPKGDAHFGCQHYAGVVNYNITGWLEKNKDPLNDTVIDQLKKGSNSLVVLIFADHPGQSAEPDKAGGKKKAGGFKTVSSGFRDQLTSLMAVLNSTSPHFIRCIVPNTVKTPGKVEAGLIMHQLTCNGVLEGIRICRKGFPNRMMYADFKQRYKMLGATIFAQEPEDKKAVTQMFDECGLDKEKYRVGNTKVFFRAGVLGEVEEMRDDRLGKLIGWLQAFIHGRRSRKDFLKLKEQRMNLIVVQRNLRKYMSLRTWAWYGFWQQLRPQLNTGRVTEMMEKLETTAEAAEKNVVIANEKNAILQAENDKLSAEKEDLLSALDMSRGGVSEFLDKEEKLMNMQRELNTTLNELNERIELETAAIEGLDDGKKKVEQNVKALQSDIEESESVLEKTNADIKTKDHQIHNFKQEIAHQSELIATVNKEKKMLQETNQKNAEDVQCIEDKCNHLFMIKGKLEQNLDETEDSLDRERKLRSNVEKAKKKIEADLRLTQETVMELESHQKEIEDIYARKEIEVSTLTTRIDDEQVITLKRTKQVKELHARLGELEDTLKVQTTARAKAEKLKQRLTREMEEVSHALDEASGITASHVELNKRREEELANLRRILQETTMQHEAVMHSLRKRHNDAVNELSDNIDHVNKNKIRAEKDRDNLRREAEDAKAQLDNLSREKFASEKMVKQVQANLNEIDAKLDESLRMLNDFDASKKKLAVENADLERQVKETDDKIASLSKLKLSLSNQNDDIRKIADAASQERVTLLGKYRHIEHDIDNLREQLDVECDGKANLLRELSHANASAQMYRAKYEAEGVARAEELENSRLKIAARLEEAETTFENLNMKNTSLEKMNRHMTAELDKMNIECERASNLASTAEFRQRNFDKILAEWRLKVDDLTSELDASQKECQNYSSELFRVKSCHEEHIDQINAIKNENKNLSDEISDLMDQISEGGKNMNEATRASKLLEVEKEELQAALEEAEAALEQEENKVLRGQLELGQIRQEIDRRLSEKEEEFNTTRKTHQRAMESMQASLETEQKAKAEAIKLKKKYESDINELELSLDRSAKASSDLHVHSRKLQEEHREIMGKITQEQKMSSEFREQYGISERRANAFHSELDESRTLLEQSDRSRRQAEGELADATDQVQGLSEHNASMATAKRALEAEMQTMHADLDEMLNEAKLSEEKMKKAMLDAARLADELCHEQEHVKSVMKAKRHLEDQVKTMESRLEDYEAEAATSGRSVQERLISRTNELKAQLDEQTNRHSEAQKNLRKAERCIKELQFQGDEDQKNQDHMQDLIDKLQQKVKGHKRQIEEAEEIAALNLAKFRKAQQDLEAYEEVIENKEAYLAITAE
ncbi:unnamed protein product [Meganyctiphanes norvegica]|uniref:Myosin heavy chain n=1 Tax=Meganyctiphanes norvegica TaxID=48144 RepID=A0AAV2R5C1_MEGNR